MKVYYFAPENTGVGLYRFWQPLKDLEDKSLIELRSWGFDFTDKVHRFPDDFPSIKELKEIASWGDIFIFGRCDHPDYFKAIQFVKEFSDKPVLLDIDDNIFAVSPYLPARQQYHPNGPAIKIHEEIAKYVDRIIVSTASLEEIYKEYNEVSIIENGIKYVLAKKVHDGINIGFMCSGSHLENAQIIEPAIIQVLSKYANVRFYYTKAFGGFMERVPDKIKDQVNFVPFYPLKNYLQYVNNLNLDIGLAPLMRNDFNRCKSNIRVLEYWQNQVSVIASPLDEYAKTIDHGFNGYLSGDDEWVHWLSDLIENPDRRNYFIQNSLRSLKEYDVSKSAQKYYDVLREMTNGNETGRCLPESSLANGSHNK